MNSEPKPKSNSVQTEGVRAESQKEKIAQSPKKFRPSLSQMILIGLIAGIGCGLFFGEGCSRLQVLGDVFIGLLQMTVLPAVVLSLISGLGRLTLEQAKQLASKGMLVLLMLWGIGFATVLLIPLVFPAWESASFFSTSLI